MSAAEPAPATLPLPAAEEELRGRCPQLVSKAWQDASPEPPASSAAMGELSESAPASSDACAQECGAVVVALGVQESSLSSAIQSALQDYLSSTDANEESPTPPPSPAPTPPPHDAPHHSLLLQTPPKTRQRTSLLSQDDALTCDPDTPQPLPWDTDYIPLDCSPSPYTIPGQEVGYPRHYLQSPIHAGWPGAGETDSPPEWDFTSSFRSPGRDSFAAQFAEAFPAYAGEAGLPGYEDAYLQSTFGAWGQAPAFPFDSWPWQSTWRTPYPPQQPAASEGFGWQGSQADRFSFTLRKADEGELGLSISHRQWDGIRVEQVKPGGAVEAWNKQCMGINAWKAISPGDMIVEVNGEQETEAMLRQIKAQRLLRLTILRGDGLPGGQGEGGRGDSFPQPGHSTMVLQ